MNNKIIRNENNAKIFDQSKRPTNFDLLIFPKIYKLYYFHIIKKKTFFVSCKTIIEKKNKPTKKKTTNEDIQNKK